MQRPAPFLKAAPARVASPCLSPPGLYRRTRSLLVLLALLEWQDGRLPKAMAPMKARHSCWHFDSLSGANTGAKQDCNMPDVSICGTVIRVKSILSEAVLSSVI
ncbi:hypothetical protein GQ53DRAFT_767016 [Thozetella sp. PMI_491]|nr:hypothetical protein GQ53DRAFT_767016 [Thozetella sp. PMI_491]